MIWQQFISGLSEHATFAPGAVDCQIGDVESALNLVCPGALRELLLQTNGVKGEYELGLVWDLERIEQENLLFRTHPEFADLYQPFDDLLFFADAGNGDQFAFPIQSDSSCDDRVLVWDHECDDRRVVASSLKEYIQHWLDGTLTL